MQLIVQKSFGSTGRGNHLTRAFELERGAFKKAKNDYIKKHQRSFWEEQTKVENDRIEEFLNVQKEKKRRDDAKLRSAIIINSKRCYESMVIHISYLIYIKKFQIKISFCLKFIINNF